MKQKIATAAFILTALSMTACNSFESARMDIENNPTELVNGNTDRADQNAGATAFSYDQLKEDIVALNREISVTDNSLLELSTSVVSTQSLLREVQESIPFDSSANNLERLSLVQSELDSLLTEQRELTSNKSALSSLPEFQNPSFGLRVMLEEKLAAAQTVIDNYNFL